MLTAKYDAEKRCRVFEERMVEKEWDPAAGNDSESTKRGGNNHSLRHRELLRKRADKFEEEAAAFKLEMDEKKARALLRRLKKEREQVPRVPASNKEKVKRNSAQGDDEVEQEEEEESSSEDENEKLKAAADKAGGSGKKNPGQKAAAAIHDGRKRKDELTELEELGGGRPEQKRRMTTGMWCDIFHVRCE